MNKSKLLITRLSPLTLCLVQVHAGDLAQAGALISGALGVLGEGSTATEGPRVYATGPAEWLLIDYSPDEVRRRLSAGLGRVMVRVTNVSAAFSSLRVEGSAARALLTSDIGAPRAATAARPGEYARTRLGQIDLLLHCVGSNTFDLHMDRTLVDYLEAWLSAQYQAHSPSAQCSGL
jgi:heterotetrameric sarcosine oxidase gamma subunit